ncbi:MAG: hypothetical protein M1819_001077 [Sarea resinae]|nr:MAG: hypothetical protein M1819_001077 [Sarea resinae]
MPTSRRQKRASQPTPTPTPKPTTSQMPLPKMEDFVFSGPGRGAVPDHGSAIPMSMIASGPDPAVYGLCCPASVAINNSSCPIPGHGGSPCFDGTRGNSNSLSVDMSMMESMVADLPPMISLDQADCLSWDDRTNRAFEHVDLIHEEFDKHVLNMQGHLNEVRKESGLVAGLMETIDRKEARVGEQAKTDRNESKNGDDELLGATGGDTGNGTEKKAEGENEEADSIQAYLTSLSPTEARAEILELEIGYINRHLERGIVTCGIFATDKLFTYDMAELAKMRMAYDKGSGSTVEFDTHLASLDPLMATVFASGMKSKIFSQGNPPEVSRSTKYKGKTGTRAALMRFSDHLKAAREGMKAINDLISEEPRPLPELKKYKLPKAVDFPGMDQAVDDLIFVIEEIDQLTARIVQEQALVKKLIKYSAQDVTVWKVVIKNAMGYSDMQRYEYLRHSMLALLLVWNRTEIKILRWFQERMIDERTDLKRGWRYELKLDYVTTQEGLDFAVKMDSTFKEAFFSVRELIEKADDFYHKGAYTKPKHLGSRKETSADVVDNDWWKVLLRTPLISNPDTKPSSSTSSSDPKILQSRSQAKVARKLSASKEKIQLKAVSSGKPMISLPHKPSKKLVSDESEPQGGHFVYDQKLPFDQHVTQLTPYLYIGSSEESSTPRPEVATPQGEPGSPSTGLSEKSYSPPPVTAAKPKSRNGDRIFTIPPSQKPKALNQPTIEDTADE